MNSTTQVSLHLIQGCAIVGMWMTTPRADADITVDLTATPLVGAFQYDFSISNSGPDDVVVVDITDAPAGDPLIGATLVTPPEFGAIYDPGVSRVTFFEDTDLFGVGTTISGFGFQSLASPGGNFTTFEAHTINGDVLAGDIRLRSAIPESGHTLLTASLGFLALALAHHQLSRLNNNPK